MNSVPQNDTVHFFKKNFNFILFMGYPKMDYNKGYEKMHIDQQVLLELATPTWYKT